MKKITLSCILLSFVFCACHRTSQSCLDMPQDKEFKDGQWRVEWAGLEWINMDREIYKDFAFDVVCRPAEYSKIDKVVKTIENELGAPIYTRKTLPMNIEPTCYNIPIYFQPDGTPLDEDDDIYWWETDDKIVRLDVFHLESSKCFAFLSIYDKVRLQEKCNNEEVLEFK